MTNESSTHIWPRTRKLSFVALAERFGISGQDQSVYGEIFFHYLHETSIPDSCFEFGLSFVPQTGSAAGKTVHFMTASQVLQKSTGEQVPIKVILASHSKLFADQAGRNANSSLRDFAIVTVPIEKHFSVEIGIAWAIPRPNVNLTKIRTELSQVVSLIERIELSAKSSQVLSVLLPVIETLGSSKLAELPKRLAQIIKDVLYADAVTVWKVDRQKKRLSSVVGIPHGSTTSLSFSEGLAPLCLETETPITVQDFENLTMLQARGLRAPKHQSWLLQHGLNSGVFGRIVRGFEAEYVVAAYFVRRFGVTKPDESLFQLVSKLFEGALRRNILTTEVVPNNEALKKLASLANFGAAARSDIHDAYRALNSSTELLSVLNVPAEEVETRRQISDQLNTAKALCFSVLELSNVPRELRESFVVSDAEDVSRHRIYPILHSHVESLRKELGKETDISVSIECDDLELRSLVSRSQFKRILKNLSDNAIYSLAQDRQNKDKKLVFRLASEETSFSLIVEDNGLGIADSVYSNITDHFTTTKVDRGFGVGLAIVKDIVDAHHGLLDYRNLKKGAQFEITLSRIPSID